MNRIGDQLVDPDQTLDSGLDHDNAVDGEPPVMDDECDRKHDFGTGHGPDHDTDHGRAHDCSYSSAQNDGSNDADQAADSLAIDERVSMEDRSLLEMVESHGQILVAVLQHVTDLRSELGIGSSARESSTDSTEIESDQAEWIAELRDQILTLQDQVDQLQRDNADLHEQNVDLASQVANSNINESVHDGHSGVQESLSWEDRKRMILEQMEADAFDAEAFVESLQQDRAACPVIETEVEQEGEVEIETPMDYVRRITEELQRRESEIEELRFLLDQQPETREDGTAVGAAAIAEMIDADELVQQERTRLQQLHEEWEEKFRQNEIEASLERAKLSRERQQLAKAQAELEEQLEHLRRQSRADADDGPKSTRRWMVKLGLSDE